MARSRAFLSSRVVSESSPRVFAGWCGSMAAGSDFSAKRTQIEQRTTKDGRSLDARPRPQLRLNPVDDNIAEYFLPAQDSFSNWNPVFNVSGPLIRNKLFFFAGYAPQLNYTTRTVNFTTGPCTEVTVTFPVPAMEPKACGMSQPPSGSTGSPPTLR